MTQSSVSKKIKKTQDGNLFMSSIGMFLLFNFKRSHAKDVS